MGLITSCTVQQEKINWKLYNFEVVFIWPDMGQKLHNHYVWGVKIIMPMNMMKTVHRCSEIDNAS